MNKRKVFNDPVHGFITIPHELVFDVIEHPYFQRLRRIKQLGLSDYVYPGAIHTRFHHALGAFHLMRKALSVLRLKGHEISAEEELAASLAILLHDIGHGPFSHTLENCLILGVPHEDISRIYMQYFAEKFGEPLHMALQIFNDEYPKRFLHQLVSSQLDVDRLDYLTRDSFFTGVNEGVISYDRIIDMMNVKDDNLVIDEKGIYSIEKFIISRRLMYWQVYLHKTVLCVEQMMVKAVIRAKELLTRGEKLTASPALLYLLTHPVSLSDFSDNKKMPELYAQLDDIDIIGALKMWQYADDKVLNLLCTSILERKLFKIIIGNESMPEAGIAELRSRVSSLLGVSVEDAAYLVFQDSTTNYAYNTSEDQINIMSNDGSIRSIVEASDLPNVNAISVPVVKYYHCFPKSLAAL